jgi:AcrR family transcriptional regulator
MSRLQEERSAETRRRLIDATVECLFERGYAGITTAEIAERAGVSKGAQLHHFPTKDQLVIAALEHLFELRVAASSSLETIRRLPKDPYKRLAAIIDMLVPVYRDKVFYAWLELVVACRTDLALREALKDASERFSDRVRKIWKELFGSPSDHSERFRLLDQFINGQFAAMAIGRILLGGAAEPKEFAEIVEELKELGNVLLRKTLSHRRKS